MSVPRLDQRIRLFLFQRTYTESLLLLEEYARIISSACSELRKSLLFAMLLKWIVKIGNMLNRDTRFFSQGFSLESLPKVLLLFSLLFSSLLPAFHLHHFCHSLLSPHFNFHPHSPPSPLLNVTLPLALTL